jgi:hypothetical protein
MFIAYEFIYTFILYAILCSINRNWRKLLWNLYSPNVMFIAYEFIYTFILYAIFNAQLIEIGGSYYGIYTAQI